MNKSDKFYLKQGRLELSMLDDDDDDEPSASSSRNELKHVEEQILFEHTKRKRDLRSSGSPKVKVNKDIYNTLHVMGQLLTKNEENTSSSLQVKKPVNMAKVQMIEQLASNVKVQDMTLPPLPPKEERLQNVSITRADEIHETAVDISLYNTEEQNEGSSENSLLEERKWYKLEKEADQQDVLYDSKVETTNSQLTNEVSTKEEADQLYAQEFNRLNSEDGFSLDGSKDVNIANDEEESKVTDQAEQIDERYSAEMEKTIQESYENVSSYHIEAKRESEAENSEKTNVSDVEEFQDPKDCQKQVDVLVESFFDNRVPQYSFTKELRKHIEKHIKALKEQKTNFTN